MAEALERALANRKLAREGGYPCDRICPVLGAQQHVARHMRALPHREMAAAIGTVRASTALPAAKLAFEFLVLTDAKWSGVR